MTAVGSTSLHRGELQLGQLFRPDKMRVTLHFSRSPTRCLLPRLGHIGQNVNDPVINAGRAS
jgi:hypothetical protein